MTAEDNIGSKSRNSRIRAVDGGEQVRPHPFRRRRVFRRLPRVHHDPRQGRLNLPLPPGMVEIGEQIALRQDGFVSPRPERAPPWSPRRLPRRPHLQGAANENCDLQEAARRRLWSWSSRELDDYVHILLSYRTKPPFEDIVALVVASAILSERRDAAEQQWRQSVIGTMRGGARWQTDY